MFWYSFILWVAELQVKPIILKTSNNARNNKFFNIPYVFFHHDFSYMFLDPIVCW